VSLLAFRCPEETGEAEYDNPKTREYEDQLEIEFVCRVVAHKARVDRHPDHQEADSQQRHSEKSRDGRGPEQWRGRANRWAIGSLHKPFELGGGCTGDISLDSGTIGRGIPSLDGTRLRRVSGK